jgi:transposase-like protein
MKIIIQSMSQKINSLPITNFNLSQNLSENPINSLYPETKPENPSQSALNLQPLTPELPICPNCNSKRNVIRSGIRHGKHKYTQRYQCKKCIKIFTTEPLINTHYQTPIILQALTHFNLGNTMQQTQKSIQRRYKIKIPISTLHNWTKRYEKDLSFIKLRKQFNLNHNTIIHSKKFYHQQVYEFKYHTLKINIARKIFPQLKSYITSIYKIPYFIPETVFQSGPRCSQQRVDFKFETTAKQNNAPKLALLAQTIAKTNLDRHQLIERTFLINDSATIATEVPVYLKPEELTLIEQEKYGLKLKEPLSGHIDILQVKFRKIYILDYKPEANNYNNYAAKQLFLYALALNKRTNIPLHDINCAYFNDKIYFEISLK